MGSEMCIRDSLQCIRTIPYYWTSMPPMHQNYSILLDLNASNASELFHIIGPQCLQSIGTIPYYWISMSPIHLNYSILLDLNASNLSDTKPAIQQASQYTSRQASHPTSKPVNRSRVAGRPRGHSGGGDGGFPRSLESGRSPGPTCPGTKYPVRGIPHFDVVSRTRIEACKLSLKQRAQRSVSEQPSMCLE